MMTIFFKNIMSNTLAFALCFSLWDYELYTLSADSFTLYLIRFAGIKK